MQNEGHDKWRMQNRCVEKAATKCYVEKQQKDAS